MGDDDDDGEFSTLGECDGDALAIRGGVGGVRFSLGESTLWDYKNYNFLIYKKTHLPLVDLDCGDNGCVGDSAAFDSFPASLSKKIH